MLDNDGKTNVEPFVTVLWVFFVLGFLYNLSIWILLRLKIKGMALISTLPGILTATGAVYQVSSAGAYPEQGMGWHQDVGAPPIPMSLA